jgi:[NiFe] hydrogenase diaphorase moiety large subunit
VEVQGVVSFYTFPDGSGGEKAPSRGSLPSFRAQAPGAGPEEGLGAALQLDPQGIIQVIDASGLRGCGGAGFPTGAKWKAAAAAQTGRKFIICNADEGEPGAFKDRAILLDHAGLVFEGMTIAARAVGAEEGILFLRGEYESLRAGLEAALARRHEGGPTFAVRIFMGAGAYICGEETALIKCLEGGRGEPADRPPFPVTSGYLGCPTVVNNVETLAWAACILARGAAWFRAGGGRKVFSVSGDCRKPGVYEFPLDSTVAQLLREVDGAGAKAVQLGGPSGQCVPAREFGRSLGDREAPACGSVLVFGPRRDMLAVLHDFMVFFAFESCGQCAPCRLGTPKLLEGVELLQAGRCSPAYLEDLRSLGETLQLASKCGLGQSAANAFLSLVAQFPEEIMDRRP